MSQYGTPPPPPTPPRYLAKILGSNQASVWRIFCRISQAVLHSTVTLCVQYVLGSVPVQYILHCFMYSQLSTVFLFCIRIVHPLCEQYCRQNFSARISTPLPLNFPFTRSTFSIFYLKEFFHLRGGTVSIYFVQRGL
jgi:hypothetical protein